MKTNINAANRPAGLILTIVLSFVLISCAFAQSEKMVSARDGMAATAHPLATKAAMEVLNKGGNAVDAAVAAAFAIGVVEPDGSGLGGGGGMVIYLKKEKKSIFINYYHRTSSEIDKVSFDFGPVKSTAKAILVPGTVAGLLTALEKYGTMSAAEVMKPAIRYAKDGFPLDETLSKIILDNTTAIQIYPSTSSVFLPEGFPLGQGDTLRQPELAATLETIAEKGRKGFYEGEIAQKIASEVQANGGMITLEDLKNYEPVISQPLHGNYRGYEIITSAPPQSGASVLEALNIIENVKFGSWGHFSQSDKSLHLLAETFKRVSADRSLHLGDPKFSKLPLNGLISKDFARERFNDINLAKVDPPKNSSVKAGYPDRYGKSEKTIFKSSGSSQEAVDEDTQDDDIFGGSNKRKNDRFDNWGKKKHKEVKENSVERVEKEADSTDAVPDADQPEAFLGNQFMQDMASIEPSYEGGHTTHLCVADKQGNMVALTQTLGNFFGSGLSVAGVLFNNGLVNFSATSEKNKIEPGKQPRSSISPTIILNKNGNPWIALGSPGAGRIIPTVTQLILNIIDFKMNINEANLAPRMYSQKFDENLYIESRIGEDVRTAMEKRGHTIQVYGDYDLFFGGAQIIMYDEADGLFYGSADPRRGGTAGGD